MKKRTTIYRSKTWLLIAPGSIVLFLFVVLPLLWIGRISFNENAAAGFMIPGFTFENYLRFLFDPWYLRHVLWFSLIFAVSATFSSIAIAYPIAITISRLNGWLKQLLITLTLAPLLIGMVSLVYGWIVLLRTNGLLNSLTMNLGLHDAPIRYMYTNKAVFILLVYIGIPYIVLTVLDTLSRIDQRLYEAAMNVGSPPSVIFYRITLPLSMPGLYAGLVVVFAMHFSAFAVPLMVGAPQTNMIGLLAFRQAMELNNLPFGAAVSIVMVLASIVVLVVFTTGMRRTFLRRLGV